MQLQEPLVFPRQQRPSQSSAREGSEAKHRGQGAKVKEAQQAEVKKDAGAPPFDATKHESSTSKVESVDANATAISTKFAGLELKENMKSSEGIDIQVMAQEQLPPSPKATPALVELPEPAPTISPTSTPIPAQPVSVEIRAVSFMQRGPTNKETARGCVSVGYF
jgi:hypothetical protein